MKSVDFKDPKFVKSAIQEKDFPLLRTLSGKIMPEIAVVGRSNVGKSSLLNDLFSTTKLVRTSATPGKTQAINFFTLNDQLAFVDLPGYGYAKVPIHVQEEWGPMIQQYFHARKTLALILFLFDIRRVPNDEDRALINWIAVHHKSMILVLTKVDKVNQQEKKANTETILKSLNAENIHYVHYSVTKKTGRSHLIRMLINALEQECEE